MVELAEGSVRHIQTTVEFLRQGDRFWWSVPDTFTREALVADTISVTVSRDGVERRVVKYTINGRHVCEPGVPVVVRFDHRHARVRKGGNHE